MAKIIPLLTLIFLMLSAQAATSYFPSSYTDSKDQLLKSFNNLKKRYGNKWEQFQLKVPSLVDQDLTIDGAYLDCSDQSVGSSKLLVLTSGVHGPEAFVGAAAQHWYLQGSINSRCEQGLSTLLIHAVNPYGFKYGRRFNEDNIDLNRNFPTTPDLYQTTNDAYEDLEFILNPKKPVGPLVIRSASVFSNLLKELIGGLSVSAIRQASVGGQYEFQKGIYYGGKGPAAQTELLTPLFKKYLNRHDQALHFDFHTGLGEKGVLHLITGPSVTDFGNQTLKSIFEKYSPHYFEITHPSDPGFYEVGGDFVDYLPKFKNNDKILGLTVEYGTVGLGLFAQLKTLTRLINENQGHHHGYRSKRIEKRVKKRLKDLFFPTEKSWRKQIQETNTFLLTKVLEDFIKMK